MQLMYERIKELGYLHPEQDGIVKPTPSHLKFRYFLYKTALLAFYTHFVWMIASSM